MKIFKKTITIAMCLGLSFSFCSCSLLPVDQNYKKALSALERGNYEVAENLFDQAVKSGCKEDDVSDLYNMIVNYNDANECVKNGDYKGAKSHIENMPKLYRHYDIKDDVDDIEDVIEDYEEATEDFEKAQSYYDSKLYAEAKAIAIDIEEKYLDADQKSKLQTIKSAKSTPATTTQPPASPAPAPVSGDTTVKYYMYVVNVKNSIYLRSSPKEVSGNIILTIPLGDQVGFIESASGGFYKVSYKGYIGYSKSKYLSTYYSSPKPTYTTMTVVNVKHSIYLRSSAKEVSGNIICEIPLGSTVTYLGETTNGFHKISWGGYTGYSKTKYLS